jgi:hypothetical protein
MNNKYANDIDTEKLSYVNRYPFNVMLDVLAGYDAEIDNEIVDKVMMMYPVGIFKAFSTLSDREQLAIKRRYFDRLTYSKIGQSEGWTGGKDPERIHRILQKVMHKLKRPSILKLCIAVTFDEFDEVRNKLAEKERLEKHLKSLIPDEDKDKIDKIPIDPIDYSSIPIDTLMLSMRSFMCLKRRGITYISDLLNLSPSNLKCTRNLGMISLSEIIYKLHEKGLELPDTPISNDLSVLNKDYKAVHNSIVIEAVTDIIKCRIDPNFSLNTKYIH